MARSARRRAILCPVAPGKGDDIGMGIDLGQGGRGGCANTITIPAGIHGGKIMKRLVVATLALFAALNAPAQDKALLEKAKSEGHVLIVHLRCDPNTAAQRLSRDPGDRTSITGAGLIEELAALHEARDGRYLTLADLSIDANEGEADAVVRRLIECLQQPE